MAGSEDGLGITGALPGAWSRDYDASLPAFLPARSGPRGESGSSVARDVQRRWSWPLSGLLVLLLAACGGGGSPNWSALVSDGDMAQVVAGTGEPSLAAVESVRHEVDAELPALLELFHRVPEHRFFVHVHAARSSLPDSLLAQLQPDSPGFALLGRHQIHLVWGELRRTGSSLRGVVVHELTHELLDQFVAPHGRLIPRWFHEGLAQSLAGDIYLGAREEDLVWRLATNRLLSFGDLRADFPEEPTELRIAYAQSYSYVAWLQREFGLETLLTIARSADNLTSFERSLVGRTRRTTLELEDAWRDHLQHASGAIWRVVLGQCFSLAMVGALPLLVLALIRRLAADQRAAARLARSEDVIEPTPADESPFDAGSESDSVDGSQGRSAP